MNGNVSKCFRQLCVPVCLQKESFMFYEEEHMRRKWLALALAGVMAASVLAGCGGGASGESSDAGASGSGSVYYLNFKPEQAEQWDFTIDAETMNHMLVYVLNEIYQMQITGNQIKSAAGDVMDVKGADELGQMLMQEIARHLPN